MKLPVRTLLGLITAFHPSTSATNIYGNKPTTSGGRSELLHCESAFLSNFDIIGRRTERNVGFEWSVNVYVVTGKYLLFC